jgi:SsrA-binding protein
MTKKQNFETPKILNRKSKYDYFLFERYEAGVELLGAEVKSIREARVNMGDSFVKIMRNEVFLINCHISLYSKIQGYQDIDPIRTRKLLLNRKEIDAISKQTERQGYAIIPTCMYFKKGRVKIEIALAKGKKQADKRESIKQRIDKRESDAEIKRHSK